jgi:hypothetical protein
MLSRGFSLTRVMAVVVATGLASAVESYSLQSQQTRVAGITSLPVSMLRLVRVLDRVRS